MDGRARLAETEQAVRARVGGLPVDTEAADALSNLYRAAHAVRNHLTQTVLRPYDLTWTGFVVLWVAWIWDGLETRQVAEHVGISKATLTGVMTTLETRGWVERRTDDKDRRRVRLFLTEKGEALMQELYPRFNEEETRVVAALTPRRLAAMTAGLRGVVAHLEDLGEPPG
jgi:DNA-binding MarR family transcriptional regulator